MPTPGNFFVRTTADVLEGAWYAPGLGALLAAQPPAFLLKQKGRSIKNTIFICGSQPVLSYHCALFERVAENVMLSAQTNVLQRF